MLKLKLQYFGKHWPNAKNWLIENDPDPGKDWEQKKMVTEDEMVGWGHWFNGHEIGQTPGDGEEWGSLVYCSPWGGKELDMTWPLNNSRYLV